MKKNKNERKQKTGSNGLWGQGRKPQPVSNDKLFEQEAQERIEEMKNRQFIFPGTIHTDMVDIVCILGIQQRFISRLRDEQDTTKQFIRADLSLLSERVKRLTDELKRNNVIGKTQKEMEEENREPSE